MASIKEILLKEVKKISDPLNITVVELNAKRGPNGLNIIVIIDKEEGVTLNDCEKISRLFNDRLEILEPIEEENYNLQVSSPGIHRIFKNKNEYNLFKSKDVKVMLKEPFDDIYKSAILEGKLRGLEDDIVTIEVDGETISIHLDSISKTKLN
ncbi:MAG: ribosome maturation factor RimP [Spirochaetes bacterium]|nr:ribosome maturation factor RimP [Spirochaetota bacterium]